MSIDTTYVTRCIATLEAALERLAPLEQDSVEYDIFRAACVKEFEVILEQSNRLLNRRLQPYFASERRVRDFTFAETFRNAARQGLLSQEECERWLAYRANRNQTAHDYGSGFAEVTLNLLPKFITDARSLALTVSEQGNG